MAWHGACVFLSPVPHCAQVYVHVDESLHGMEVIKAFNAVNYFIQVSDRRPVVALQQARS
jgi:hypothetical protein